MENKPKYSLDLGPKIGEELFLALSADLGVKSQDIVSFDTLCHEYPVYYRLINKALCTRDPSLLRGIPTQSLPPVVIGWLEDCAYALACKGSTPHDVWGRTRNGVTWQQLARSIAKVRQYFGLYSRLTSKDETWDQQCLAALETFERRVTEKVTLASDNLFSLVGEAFFRGCDLQKDLADGTIVPRHGPGAVSEGLKPSSKQLQVYRDRGVVFTRMPFLNHEYFRVPMNYGPNPCAAWLESLNSRVPPWVFTQTWECELEQRELSSKVLCVPKDFRGPRIIAKAPTILQYLQLGIDDQLKRFLKRSSLRSAVHPHTQDFNRDAAILGSLKQNNVTIDLSDASDTVRCCHVDQMLKFRKDLHDVVYGLRPDSCVLPSGKSLRPTTFSLMGDGVTFRLETIVFSLEAITAIITQGVEKQERWIQPFCKCGHLKEVSPRLIREAAITSHLLVYGDDIIVDYRYANSVINRLRARSYNVSTDKTCMRGFFRESCGMDAFHGMDITALRPRHLPGASEQTLSGYVDLINQAAARGYLAFAIYLRRALARLGHVVPIEPSDQNTQGLIHSDLLYDLARKPAQIRSAKLRESQLDGFLVKTAVDILSMRDFAEGCFDHTYYWRSLSPHQEELWPGWPDGLSIRHTWVHGLGLTPKNLDPATEELFLRL